MPTSDFELNPKNLNRIEAKVTRRAQEIEAKKRQVVQRGGSGTVTYVSDKETNWFKRIRNGVGTAVLGGLVVGGAYTVYEKYIADTDVAQTGASALCGVTEAGASAIHSDACSTKVTTTWQMRPADPASTVPIEAGIEYLLSSQAQVKGLREGAGVGLYIQVEAVEGPNYAQTINAKEGDEPNALGIFANFTSIVQAGGPNALVAYNTCIAEAHALTDAVREHPEKFANGSDFPADYLKDPTITHTRIDYDPFTDVPLPTEPRREIVFMDGTKELLCPAPS